MLVFEISTEGKIVTVHPVQQTRTDLKHLTLFNTVVITEDSYYAWILNGMDAI